MCTSHPRLVGSLQHPRLRLLQSLSHDALESLTELRCNAVAAAEQSQRDPSTLPDGRRDPSTLPPQDTSALHSALLRCDAPDTLLLAGSSSMCS